MKKVFCFNFIVFVLLDRVLKIWVNLKYPNIIVKNHAIAFGFISNKLVSFTILAISMTLLAYLVIKNNYKNKFQTISLSLISAGAISNIFDRIYYNYVVDYIQFFSLNTYNIADVLILFGIFGIIYSYSSDGNR